jgi:hypothetical protein
MRHVIFASIKEYYRQNPEYKKKYAFNLDCRNHIPFKCFFGEKDDQMNVVSGSLRMKAHVLPEKGKSHFVCLTVFLDREGKLKRLGAFFCWISADSEA